MGGTKRKIPMERIEKKESRSVAFSKRREGLYRKASELCRLCDAHIAILVTPPSANSNVSFYSFGHSSVDDVVDAFLHNRPPTSSHDHALSKNRDRLAGKKPSSGLGFRWEEDGFEETANTRDLEVAIDEISELMNIVKRRLDDKMNETPRLAETTNLAEPSVLGLESDGGKRDDSLVGNLAPQVSDQPIMAISDIGFEELGEGPTMEGVVPLSHKEFQDIIDNFNFDDIAPDFCF
ncbi:PREDICTED: agamous-like MADS-box protein AGL97 [Tarenaya hassleriana]|uniref:agamous-like MADS-box protein AGL97 n=1 Tax=Tarenaya hassleriana TaxID=28532 RepID=UPI00053C96A9|nr:PREDICTED: agamous-like MADS-box protein AGL97 [Tarenaya hassleriana]XP_010535252.1 PREDICTED: agamous-like MADS-box protein AGL97 [Tarenaya hassleriana]